MVTGLILLIRWYNLIQIFTLPIFQVYFIYGVKLIAFPESWWWKRIKLFICQFLSLFVLSGSASWRGRFGTNLKKKEIIAVATSIQKTETRLFLYSAGYFHLFDCKLTSIGTKWCNLTTLTLKNGKMTLFVKG